MINILAIAPAARRVRYLIKAVNSVDMTSWHKDRELAKPFSRFCALCHELAADGFSYQVRIIPEPSGLLSIEVTGTASRATRSKAPRRARITPPAKKTAEYCAKQRAEAEKRINGAAAPLEPAEYDAAIADVEYWRELESLAETRDKWKPGIGPDVDKSDMEVRAA